MLRNKIDFCSQKRSQHLPECQIFTFSNPLKKLKDLKNWRWGQYGMDYPLHMYGKNIQASIDSVSTIINLEKTGGFYSVRLKIPESPTINLSERMFGKAEVVIGNMGFWTRVRGK